MKAKIFFNIASCVLPFMALADTIEIFPQKIAATSSDIKYSGRTKVDENRNVRFNYPGVSARLNYKGTGIQMVTSPGSGYWVVETDSLPPIKFHVADSDSVITVDGLHDGPHSTTFTYCIEGYEFNPEIRSFRLPDGGLLLNRDSDKKLKLEFIGNSITCGYGTEADDANIHFSYDTENHCLSYAHLTTMALDADANMVCRSGIGVYRKYADPREGGAGMLMPGEYENTMLYVYDSPWDFSSFRPDIICINLGTNDLSCDNYDVNLFQAAYDGFVNQVRTLNPDSKIVLLTGAMLSGKELDIAKSVLDDVATRYTNVYRFDMSPQDGSLGYGGDYHPSRAQAQKMAAELTEFLKSILQGYSESERHTDAGS